MDSSRKCLSSYDFSRLLFLPTAQAGGGRAGRVDGHSGLQPGPLPRGMRKWFTLPSSNGPKRMCFADFKSPVGHFSLFKNIPSWMPREESADEFVQPLNCEKKI